MTNQLPMSQTGGLVKPPRINYTRVDAASLKPPTKRETNDQIHCTLRYVTEAGKELTLPCTPAMFVKIIGKRSKRRAHSGLDQQIYSNFVLVVNQETHQVEGIDVYPNRPVLHNLARADAPQHGNVVMFVDTTTGDMTIEDYPDEVNRTHMRRLMKAVDEIGAIDVGDSLAGFEVTSVAGGRVYFSTDNVDDMTTLINEEDVFTIKEDDLDQVGTGGQGMGQGMGGIGYKTPSGGGTGSDVFSH